LILAGEAVSFIESGSVSRLFSEFGCRPKFFMTQKSENLPYSWKKSNFVVDRRKYILLRGKNQILSRKKNATCASLNPFF
jgi:hypothetical protein